ncbi:MAG: LicD family protein [Clostridia bacterium]|nr:LicD family protein [Clostridia bacterium]
MKRLTLDEMHEALLGILSEFDRVCRENGLRYTISHGTLIGAVRHKGFIPWDDDIDVCMPRPDYEKLYALVKSGEVQLSEHYLLSEDRGKKALYPFFKLMDDRYPIKTWSNKEVPYLYLDVFPLDGAPDTEKGVKKLRKKRTLNLGVCALARWAVPMDKKWKVIYRALFFPFYVGCWLYGTARAARKVNKNALKNDFNTCKKCAVFNFSTEKWLMDCDDFSDLIELPFENLKVYAIANYDAWLSQIYGNYMQLPPESKRVTHGLKVWKADEN